MITIKAAMDIAEAKKGLKELGAEAEKVAETTAQATEQANTGLEEELERVKALKAEFEAMQAAQDAEKKAAEDSEQQSRKAEKAAQDAAAAAEIHKLRIGEMTKSIGEGLSQAVETIKASGDLGDAASKFTEKLGQGVSQFNPIAGIAIQAAAHIGKMVWDMTDFAKRSKEAAEEQRRIAEAAKTTSENVAKGLSSAAATVAALKNQGEAWDALQRVEDRLYQIGRTQQLINEEMGNATEEQKAWYAEEAKSLKSEELRLQMTRGLIIERRQFLPKLKEENTVAERMKQAEREIANIRKETTKKQIEEIDNVETLNYEIKKTETLLRQNFKVYKDDNDQRRRLLQDLDRLEKQLHATKKKRIEDAAALQKKMDEEEVARVKKAEEEERARLKQDEEARLAIKMDGWNREWQARQAFEAKMRGEGSVQQTAKGLQEGTNDERKVFEAFVRDRVKAAEASAKASIDAAQAKAEEEARKSGADEEGIKEYGREARRKAAAEARGAGARARAQAAKDWRDFQTGKDLEKSDPNDGVQDEGESRHEQTKRDIERSRQDIITKNRERADKDAARQRGLTPKERDIQKQGMDVAERQAREQAAQGEEINQWAERVKALEKQVAALEAAGAERRRRNGGRP